jgi:hypothetical protein
MLKHGRALSSLLAIIVFLALTACSQESEEEQPGVPTQEEESFQDSTGGGSA